LYGAADEVNATAAHFNEEEDVEPRQPDRVHGEEVGCQDLVGVLADELAPGPLAAARCRLQAMASEHLAHGEMGTPVAQLEQLPNDPSVAPTLVLPG